MAKVVLGFLLTIVYCLLATAATAAQDTGGIKGRVRSFRGDTISAATITARQNSQDVKSTTSNGKGEFNLSGLQPGIYNFVFDAQGFVPGIKYNVEIKKGKTKDLGDQLYLNVDRGLAGMVVETVVFFKDGTSVRGAKVDVEKVTDEGTQHVLTGFTNISGDFAFSRPPSKTKFRITATYKDVTATKEIEAEIAAVYRVALNLDMDRPQKP